MLINFRLVKTKQKKNGLHFPIPQMTHRKKFSNLQVSEDYSYWTIILLYIYTKIISIKIIIKKYT